MNANQLRIRDIVRWDGRLYNLTWIKPSRGVCKIQNPNTDQIAKLVQLNQIEFVARPIDSKRTQNKLLKQFLSYCRGRKV